MSTNVQKLLEQPTVGFRIGGRRVQIDFGELFFPAIALVFSAAYYLETRDLPEQSLMYARWLLYTTVLLAVITFLRHALSVQSANDDHPGSTDDEAADTGEGSKDGGVSQSGQSEDEKAESAVEADSAAEAIEAEQEGMNKNFTLRTSVGLAVFTAGYIILLNFLSFVVTSILFLAITLYMFGERNPIRLLGYSVGFTLLLWAVFIQWLLVPLP